METNLQFKAKEAYFLVHSILKTINELIEKNILTDKNLIKQLTNDLERSIMLLQEIKQYSLMPHEQLNPNLINKLLNKKTGWKPQVYRSNNDVVRAKPSNKKQHIRALEYLTEPCEAVLTAMGADLQKTWKTKDLIKSMENIGFKFVVENKKLVVEQSIARIMANYQGSVIPVFEEKTRKNKDGVEVAYQAVAGYKLNEDWYNNTFTNALMVRDEEYGAV